MSISGLSGVYSFNRRGGHLSLIPWAHKNTISPMGINFYFDRFAQCNNSFEHSNRMYTIPTERARCRLSEQGLSAKVHARTLLLCRPPLEQSRRKFSLQCQSKSDEIDEYLDSTFRINATSNDATQLPNKLRFLLILAVRRVRSLLTHRIRVGGQT